MRKVEDRRLTDKAIRVSLYYKIKHFLGKNIESLYYKVKHFGLKGKRERNFRFDVPLLLRIPPKGGYSLEEELRKIFKKNFTFPKRGI